MILQRNLLQILTKRISLAQWDPPRRAPPKWTIYWNTLVLRNGECTSPCTHLGSHRSWHTIWQKGEPSMKGDSELFKPCGSAALMAVICSPHGIVGAPLVYWKGSRDLKQFNFMWKHLQHSRYEKVGSKHLKKLHGFLYGSLENSVGWVLPAKS